MENIIDTLNLTFKFSWIEMNSILKALKTFQHLSLILLHFCVTFQILTKNLRHSIAAHINGFDTNLIVPGITAK